MAHGTPLETNPVGNGPGAAASRRPALAVWALCFDLTLGRNYRLRCALAVALLGLEVLLLTLRFDAGAIAAQDGMAGWLLRLTPYIPRVVLAGAFVLGLIHWEWRLDITAWVSETAGRNHYWRGWTAANLVCLVILFTLSCAIFDSRVSTISEATLVAWLSVAAATGLAALGIALPPSEVMRAAVHRSRSIALALVIGLLTTQVGLLTQLLWQPLSHGTFSLVSALLSMTTSDLLVDPVTRELGTSRFWVTIAPQCSGYEGMGLMTVLLAVFAVLFRRRLRFPRALLLWPIGIGLIFLTNAVRITALILIGTHYSPQVAMGGFHSQAGWILFNAAALGLMAAALRLRFFAVTLATPRQNIASAARSRLQAGRRNGFPTQMYLVPFLVLMGSQMLTTALATDPEELYPLRCLATAAALIGSWPLLKEMSLRCCPLATACGVGVFLFWIPLALAEEVGLSTSLAACQGNWSVLTAALQNASTSNASVATGFGWTLMRIVGGVVIIPVVEELAFRGYLMRRLVSLDFDHIRYQQTPLWSLAATSVAFGLLHELWFAGVLAGLAYGWLVRRTGRLQDGIWAHAVTNGLIALTVLATDSSWLW